MLAPVQAELARCPENRVPCRAARHRFGVIESEKAFSLVLSTVKTMTLYRALVPSACKERTTPAIKASSARLMKL